MTTLVHTENVNGACWANTLICVLEMERSAVVAAVILLSFVPLQGNKAGVLMGYNYTSQTVFPCAVYRLDASEVTNCSILPHYICNEWRWGEHLASKL